MMDSTQTNERSIIESSALNIWLLIIYSTPFEASKNGKKTDAIKNIRVESISLPERLIIKPKRIKKTKRTKSPVFIALMFFSINQNLMKAIISIY